MIAPRASSPIRSFLLLLALVASALLALTLMAPSTASAAEDPASNPVDVIADATEPFIVDDGVATPSFDEEAAIAAGASDDVLTAGAAFEALVAARAAVDGDAAGTAAADPVPTLMNGVPVWGNWCGPGHGGGPAVDTLDRLCQRHDECYGQRGYFDCYCDAQLKAEIDRFAHQMTTGERAMAAAVKLAFSTGICNPF